MKILKKKSQLINLRMRKDKEEDNEQEREDKEGRKKAINLLEN